MATLDPTPDQPDVDAGRRQLDARQRRRGPSLGTWMVGAAVAVWVGVMLVTVGPLAPGGAGDDDTDLTEGPAAATWTAPAPPTAATRGPAPMALVAPSEREPVPAFTIPDTDGEPATLDDYAGRVLLLNFWATWCGPCKAEMPWFVAFEDVFAEDGFAVLGVSLDEPGWDVVRPYLAENPVNYRIALANTAELAAPFGGDKYVLPETWLIDRQGRIAGEHIGLVDREGLEAAIRQLLAE